jgi:hypothetical protein
LLRYWDGTTWTEHRQPDPAATPPEPRRVIAVETDPMAEYERQFESSPSSMFELPSPDLPGFNFDQGSFDSPTPFSDAIAPTSDPTSSPASELAMYHPQAPLTAPGAPAPAHEFVGAPASVPRSFAPRPAPADFAALGPIALGPASVPPITPPDAFESRAARAQPRSETANLLSKPETIVVASNPAHREILAIAAPISPPGVVAPNRQRVLSAARAMGIAVLVVLIGVAAIAFFSTQSLAGPGELKTTGIVTSLGSTTGNSCTPIARFAVEGESLTADANVAITPCPVGLGQDVDVIYSAANPASGARVQFGSSITQYLWVFPVLGFLLFLGALTTFVVRAGSIASGIRVLRNGGKRVRSTTAATE